MKPLTLVPPAQAEALYDAQEQTFIGDRFAPLPWLDDDYSEDESRLSAVPLTDQANQNRLFAHLQAA
jgi:hypothetical protein